VRPDTAGRTAMRVVLVIVGIAIVACGESKAEAANRAAVTPLLHRNRSLTQEYVRWVERENEGGVTWGQAFEQKEKFVAAKESVLAELRKVVPTPRYDCVMQLAARSIEADIATITARTSAGRQQMRANSASDLALKWSREAIASEYSSSYWTKSAREQYEEAKEAVKQASGFKEASNREAVRAQWVADSLRVAVPAMKLLPSMEHARYPIMTDSGPDTLLAPAKAALIASCGQ